MTALIVLRPEPGASATLASARERGLDARAIPLFAIEPLPWVEPNPAAFDALLLTSANAVRQGGDGLDRFCHLPAYAVGAATAAAARARGFAIAATGTGGVRTLLGGMDPGLRLLHLCGEDRRDPGNVPQTITAIPVYRARLVEPAPDVTTATDSVVLVHSPRAAQRLVELIERTGIARDRIAIAAVSAEAAAAAGNGWSAIAAADEPTDDALLALAARLCNTTAPK